MAKEVEGASLAAVKSASLVLKTSAVGEIRSVVGVDMRLSGVGPKGAKVGVTYKVDGPTSLVRATGPLHFVENDTKAGPRPRKRGSRKRPAGREYGHPGTKGQRPFGKGIEKAQDKAFKILRKAQIDAVTRGLRS